MRMLMVAGAVVCLAGGMARADAYIKNVTETEAMQLGGQTRPASSDTTEIWVSPSRAAMVMGGGQKFIVDAKKQTLCFVRADQKVYAEIPAGALGKMLDSTAAAAAAADPAADSLRQKLGGLMGNMTYTVQRTDSTRKIDQWNTRKFIITMTLGMGATVTSEAWATTDAKIDWSMYRALMLQAMAFLPNAGDMYKEGMKIEGIAVLVNVSTAMMGMEMKSVQRLLAFEENKPAPAGVYDIPEDYRKENSPYLILGQ